MTRNTILSLALMGALAVPALAQNQPAPPSSQPQATQSSSQDTQTSVQATATTPETATGKDPLQNSRKEGFWGHLNPFARKKYVQKQLDPVRGRINELDELTATNTKMIKDVDARATEGIRVASLRANEADQHAVDAGNRAQLAHQTATQATERLNSVQKVVTNIDQFQTSSEAEIRFRPGQIALSKKAKDALDDLATPLKSQKGYVIQVRGYAPGSGAAAVQSSRKIADSVVRYLVLQHEVPVYRIFPVGMGNAPEKTEDGKIRRASGGGRVEIALLKNGAGDLEFAPANSSAPSSNSSAPVSSPAAAPAAPAATQPAPQSNVNEEKPASGMPQNDSTSKPEATTPAPK
jgi:outer membrane protein OmpA-like peptidoglycan-associated protein